jgi:uncharacterized protein YukE
LTAGHNWKGFARDAAQRAIDRYNTAAQAQVGELNDIATNLHTAGLRYAEVDEEQSARVGQAKKFGDKNGYGAALGENTNRWTDKDLYPHDPTAADVNQDSIGDCYLDSTMGAIANANPQWIKDRIRYDDKTGNFQVSLWNGNQWNNIAVSQDDIRTDIEHRGASWLDNGQPNAPLWPSVLESAYAKFKAPSDNLGHALDKSIGQGGYPQDAMEAFTGNRGKIIDPQGVCLTRQHLDQEIATALGNHQPVTISTNPHGQPLHQSHTYVVESISGTGSDAQITLRNPWNCDDDNPLKTMRLGDIIGSGVPDIGGRIPTNRFDRHPANNVNIGSLG